MENIYLYESYDLEHDIENFVMMDGDLDNESNKIPCH